MDEALPPIELSVDAAPAIPRLPGTVVARPDTDAVIDALLADLFIHAGNCVRTFGDFHFALSATPEIEPVVRRLMYDLSYREFPWGRTRVWMVEEVSVPDEDERQRWSGIRDLIVEMSGMPKEQAHRIPAMEHDAPQRYEALLREHLGWREKGHDRLDFVLLPLQPGCHVGGVVAASPAPGVDAQAPLVAHCTDEVPARIAVTTRLVNGARLVALFAAGPHCAPEVARLLDLRGRKESRADAPASMLSPRAAELRWYLDHAACRV